VERWRAALTLLGADAEAFAWRYAAFELDPNVPPEGMDRDAYMAGRYDPATVKAMGDRLAQIARHEGLRMADPATLTIRPNTFAAHRLMTAALQAGVSIQQALGDALFAAYWGRGEDIGDHGVLAAAAEAASMDAAAAAEVFAGDAFAAEVRAQEREAARSGIHAVPTFVFDGRFSVSGAQDPPALAAAARRALSCG
jgi:predicted DsbA family dithiol-disulfide isomerase